MFIAKMPSSTAAPLAVKGANHLTWVDEIKTLGTFFISSYSQDTKVRHFLHKYLPINDLEQFENYISFTKMAEETFQDRPAFCIFICKIWAILSTPLCVNSPPPSAAYTHQWTGSALVQVMACRLFGAKPLPKPMLAYCLLNSWEQISVKFVS